MIFDPSKIYEKNPDDIKDREGFPRVRIEMGEVQELANSIRDKGQIHPILITDKDELISGGRRRAACKLLGINVKCIYKAQISNIELRELELEENLMRKDLEWPEKIALIKEITELKQGIHGKGGAGKDYGWSNQSTADLMGIDRGSVSKAIALADAVEKFPQIKEAKTESDARKMLDKIEEAAILAVLSQRKEEFAPFASSIADSSFIIGDAFAGIQAQPDSTFDFADVDTPYGIDLDSNKKTAQTEESLKTMARYTEWSKEKYPSNIRLIAKEVYRTLKPNGWMLFWFGIEWYETVLTACREAGFAVDIIPNIWYGGEGQAQTMMPQVNLGRAYDTFISCRKGQPALVKAGRANVFHFNKVPSGQKIHPTEKPLPLMKELVETFINPGSKAIIPFHGSGNTLRALLQHGCTGIGWELDEQLKLKCMLRIEADSKQN